MISTPRQLIFRWPHSPSFAREDFLPAASNRDALRAIEVWPNWASRMLLLIGPEGAGKSHLGAIWAGAAGAITLSGEALNERSFETCAQASAVLIDDADRATQAETYLRHIMNTYSRECDVAAAFDLAQPRRMAGASKLPDLLSRLRLSAGGKARRAGCRANRSSAFQAVQRSPASGRATRSRVHCSENRTLAWGRARDCRHA